jgi:glycosyltransferase involved in cell wall biosynthesis
VIIALDATPLTEPTGGVARYTWELARALAVEFPKDEYWLLSDQPFSLLKERPIPENLKFGGQPSNVVDRRWWLWGLQREMQRRGVELFHGTDFAVPYLLPRPSVMTIHDLSPWLNPPRDVGANWQPNADRVRRRTPRLLKFGLATMVVTPSEVVRHAVIDRFAMPPDRVVATPLAAGELFRPVETASAATPYFLFVGTLEPRKNIRRMIEAWREVCKTHLVGLVIVGRVRVDFPRPEAQPGLRVLDAVPDAELPGLYSGALACLYPSLYEGFGLPVLEAMQCGATVITSRDPAILEVTGGADSGNAVHVDATDTVALAQAMGAVASDPQSFLPMRERALKRAAQFSWSATARRTHEVYEEACRVF